MGKMLSKTRLLLEDTLAASDYGFDAIAKAIRVNRKLASSYLKDSEGYQALECMREVLVKDLQKLNERKNIARIMHYNVGDVVPDELIQQALESAQMLQEWWTEEITVDSTDVTKIEYGNGFVTIYTVPNVLEFIERTAQTERISFKRRSNVEIVLILRPDELEDFLKKTHDYTETYLNRITSGGDMNEI